MIKLSVMYPSGDGRHFDIDYYVSHHMPMVATLCSGAVKKWEVDHGLAGLEPGSPPPYLAAGHLYFDSLEAFGSSMVPHLPQIQGDIPNYTNAPPVVQFSQVRG